MEHQSKTLSWLVAHGVQKREKTQTRKLLRFFRIAGRHGTGNTAVCKRQTPSLPSFLVPRSFSSCCKENGSSRNDLTVRRFLSWLNATLFHFFPFFFPFLYPSSSFTVVPPFLSRFSSNPTQRHAAGIEVLIVSCRYGLIGNIWISSRFA